MEILKLASRAAHKAKLADKSVQQPFSAFPVFETEFWTNIFKHAKAPRTAQAVMDAMAIIEQEPCVDNERVWNNIQQAKSFARLALLN